MWKNWENIKEFITIESFIPDNELEFIAPITLILFVVVVLIAFIYWVGNSFNKKFKDEQKTFSEDKK